MSQLGSPSNGRPRPKIQIANVFPSNSFPDSLVAGRRPPREKADRDSDDGSVTPITPAGQVAVLAFQNAARAASSNDSERVNERASEREQALAEEKERQRRLRDKLHDVRPNGKSRAGDIDDILDQISEEWGSFFDSEFNPVDSALWLMENASDQAFDSFQTAKYSLEKKLKGTVDNNHQSFAAALPRHASLSASLSTTQSQISILRTTLQETRETFGTKRANLMQLWSRGQTLEEMLRLLDRIENLKSVPDTLESLMTEKRLLQASSLLVRSLKTIKRPDMLEIGALSDLRSYLLNQETALKEILIEELHTHLYLKSFWCEARWAAYTPGQQTFPTVEFEKNLPISDIMDSPYLPHSAKPRRLSRFLNNLILRPNTTPVDISEELITDRTSSVSSSFFAKPPSSSNPESDSFCYIETLLESLAILGQLSTALDIVAQRLPVEIYALSKNTIQEVSERAEFNKRTTLLAPGNGSSGRPATVFSSWRQVSPLALPLTSLEYGISPADKETLSDLFWTLYSKLDAILQGLRAVFEVSNRICLRREFKDVSGNRTGMIFPLSELWYSIQSEIQTLLDQYLLDEERGQIAGRNTLKSINEVLREGRSSSDKAKSVFRFSDSDSKYIMKTLKRHEEGLTRVLKDAVPGLVQSTSEQATQTSLSVIGADDRLTEAGHRVLIKPDAFHINSIFRPTLCFLERVSDVLPNGTEFARSCNSFVDEFVLNVYLPQLEEKVQAIYQSTISGEQAVFNPDAFQPSLNVIDTSSPPLIKAVVQLMALINSLCFMLRSIPYHRENYSRLVLGIIIQFYQCCNDYFRDLVSRLVLGQGTETQILISATWAQRPEITVCLSAMYSNLVQEPKKRQNLCRQEARIMLGLLGGETISYDDLLMPTRKLKSLGHLYYSLTWFIERLNGLKVLSEEPTSPGVNAVDSPTNKPPFSFDMSMAPPPSSVEDLTLPLTRAMALRFDALMKTYEQLAEIIIFTIRTDIRCRTIHYLHLSLQRSNYQVEKEPVEPDPHIVEFNLEVGKCDDATVASLPEPEHLFVFEGLGALMEQVLISGSRHIRFMNENGVKKILRNVISLQQNLKTLTAGQGNTGLERVKLFYGLFSVTPVEMLKSIKEKPLFTFEEYRSMLNFQCGVDQFIRDPVNIQPTDPEYNTYIRQLHELAIADITDD